MLPLAGLLALLACGDSSSAPVIASPGDASFGEVDVGGSAARRMEITNTTTSPLTLTEVSTSGSLVASGDALPLTIAPGETANLSVDLAPTTEGDVSGAVEFLAADDTPVAVFQASGRGVRPTKLTSSAATASFGDVTVGTTAKQDVTLTNAGATPVSIASLAVSAAGVTATGLPLPATFAPGESATLTLTYAPTVVGPVSGSVAVRSDKGRPVSVVDISGNGVSAAPEPTPEPTPVPVPATLAASPTRVDFGQVTVGSFSAQGVTLTNRTSEPIAVSEILTAGSGFTTSGFTAGATLAPGASATLTTRFTPAAQGTASGRVTLRTAGQTEPLAVVDLAGSGVAAASITGVTVRDTTVETSKTVQVQADVVAVGTIDKSLTWSVDPGSLGTIDPVTGVYSAPAAPGTYRVWATSNADPSKKGTGSVVVTVPPVQPTEPAPTPTLPPGVVPAFPGAEGGGALSKGGRGGVVYEVTNLNDSGAGSLRACILATGPRTCVFRVGGTIELATPISIWSPYLTVAGQTAPGGGIQISGRRLTSGTMFELHAHNVVWQYTRIRMGYNASRPANVGANLAIYNQSYNIIFDHNSFTWATDDMINVFSNTAGSGARDITFSWNLIGEGLKAQSTPVSTGASYHSAADVMTDIDYHRNFVTTFSHRGPLIGHKRGRYVNNITYNWQYWTTIVESGVHADFIGNLWKAGPLYPITYNHEIILYPYNNLGGPSSADPSLYVAGNKGPHNSDPAIDNWTAMVRQTDVMYGGKEIGVPSTSYKRTTPLAPAGIAITASSVNNLEAEILPAVGASRRLDCSGNWVSNRDSSDTRMVNNYRAGTGFIPATESDVGGFPVLAAGTQCADTDHDGMPDAWETTQGLNANDPADRNSRASESIYTNLERYLAGI